MFNVHLSIEEIANATLCFDEGRIGRIAFEFAPKPENQNIDAAIKHFLLVHSAGGDELFA